jgi:hypothetical protein
LPEIISLLKASEGRGGYLDYENVMGLLMSGIGKKPLDLFKEWCFRNRFTLSQGLLKASRFPIPGLKPSRQQTLNEFSRQLLAVQRKYVRFVGVGKIAVSGKKHQISSAF